MNRWRSALWNTARRAVGGRSDALPADGSTGRVRATALDHSPAPEVAPESDVERNRAERRTALASGGFEPSALTAYGRFLIEQTQGTAAEEILALSLAADGAQVEALELYQDLCRELELPDRRWWWALSRLSADIETSAEAHRGALDFAIPYRLDSVLAAVENGEDPVSKCIVEVDRAFEGSSTPDGKFDLTASGLGENDQLRVQLTVLLGRRRYHDAIELLKDADPSAVPRNALRRALRRARAEGAIEEAIECARAYHQLHPSDEWSASLEEKLRIEAVSNDRIAQIGFPFPSQQQVRRYEPRSDHVLYAVHNSLPFHATGYATRSHGILTALREQDWEVEAVTRLGYPYDLPGNAFMPEVPERDRIDGVTYRRLLHGREIEQKNPVVPYVERYASALEELALAQRPAIIHAASNHVNGLAAVTAARRLGIPSIYEVRGLWEITRASRDPEFSDSKVFDFLSRMEADAAQGATKVLTLTAALRDEMVRRGVDGDKISVVPNGVDTERFTPQPREEELAAQLGLQGKTVIGYVGSVLDYEGLDLLIDAAAEMKMSRQDFHVLIVGDGAELNRLREHVTAHDLEDVVTFTGRVEHHQVERFYSIIDIAPFPRLPVRVCELVSPLKPFEAMAMGKAVVVSDVAALKEFIVPGVNGVSHDKGSAVSLTEQLNTLLDDPSLAHSLSENARKWVVANRDWRSIAHRIAAIYAELR